MALFTIYPSERYDKFFLVSTDTDKIKTGDRVVASRLFRPKGDDSRVYGQVKSIDTDTRTLLLRVFSSGEEIKIGLDLFYLIVKVCNNNSYGR